MTFNSNSIISKLLLNFYNFDTKLNKLHSTSYFCKVGPRIQIRGICNNPEKLIFKVNRGLGNELAHIISAVDVDLSSIHSLRFDILSSVPESSYGPQA